MTSISNVNNQMSYFSELPQELKSVIYSKLCDFAKSEDKEALKALIQSAYVSKQFFHDPEVKKDRNLCVLDIKVKQECSDDIYKVYLYSLDKLGFLPMIGHSSITGPGSFYPNVKEMKHPFAFIQDKQSGHRGFVVKVHGKMDATAHVLNVISRKKIPIKDISDYIFVFQRYISSYPWQITGNIPNLTQVFYFECDQSLPIPKCLADRWMPIILNILERKDPYFELDSGK